MAIAYKSQGAGVATETSGAACSPLCPATVDANDILIAHAYFEGTTTAPDTPSGWTLLEGPHDIGTTVVARHWVYGKIAAGTEDGAAVAFGSQAVTTMRAGRVYSFSGYVSGSITALVNGFAATSHATDPQMPTVTTTATGALAVALVGQNDNNAFASATGESGGDWVEAVAEFTAALTPGLALGIQTCTPTADPGTVSGGSIATTNDPCGVIGFQILAQPSSTTATPSAASAAWAKTASTVVLGTRTMTPSAAAATWGLFAPTIVGSQTATPSAVVAAFAIASPTVVPGVRTLTPAAAAALFGIAAPTVVLGVRTMTPAATAAAWGVAAAQTSQGQNMTPGAIPLVITVGSPTIIKGPVLLAPSVAQILLGIAAPTVVAGPVLLTPSAMTGAFSVAVVTLPSGAEVWVLRRYHYGLGIGH